MQTKLPRHMFSGCVVPKIEWEKKEPAMIGPAWRLKLADFSKKPLMDQIKLAAIGYVLPLDEAWLIRPDPPLSLYKYPSRSWVFSLYALEVHLFMLSSGLGYCCP